MMEEAFDEAWDLLEKSLQDNLAAMAESIRLGNRDPVPPPMTALAGNKGDRGYQKFLRDAFDEVGARHLFEPFAGAAGVSFALRAPETTIGNDLDPTKINYLRQIRDNPLALNYDPIEEYMVRVGQPRRMHAGMMDTEGFDVGEYTQDDVDLWRAMYPTQARKLPYGDAMLDHVRPYWNMRHEMWRIAAENPNWGADPALSLRMAQLMARLQPLTHTGYWRSAPFLSVSPRGPVPANYKFMREHFPQVEQRYEEMKDAYNERMFNLPAYPKEAGMRRRLGVGGKNALNAFLPTRLQQVDVDRPVDFTPASQIMRQGVWNFLQGPFDSAYDEMRESGWVQDPSGLFVVSDPPYLGARGEHQWTEELALRNIGRLKEFADAGIPIVAYDGMSPATIQAREDIGMNVIPFLQMNRKGPARAKARGTIETIGTANLPFITSEHIQDITGYPAPPQAFNRVTGYSTDPERPL